MDRITTPAPAVAKPKLLVLGATGGTGRHIVRQAVEQGYDVTVLARSAEKASKLNGATIVVGDALDPAAVRRSLEGRDAVISALGTPASPFREVTLLSSATLVLVDALKAENVKRLVAVTGIGAGDSAGHGGFLFDRLIFPLLLRHVYADKNRQEAIVRNSGLDWTLVRPSVLNDKTMGKPIRALEDLSRFHGGTISRADVASFVLDQVTGDEWLHRSPLVTW
ncbi:NAD(P)-dependent oxidoreductase [Aureimonas psammosilenae]|uniref:NAD(P)-dependent oxidoreductase n=1 Tax=Aureimonas psammosilenae TaxID=2495496 RepID=UPI001260C245|nr:SDR family oxidoreductase [Aureimonas psammosilenae]